MKKLSQARMVGECPFDPEGPIGAAVAATWHLENDHPVNWAKFLLRYKFRKGKHAGKTWDEVYAVDNDYLLWMESNKSFNKKFRKLIRTFLTIKGKLQ